MERGVRPLAGRFMDLLFPPSLYCSCCGNLIDETRTYNLCDHCIRHIKWDMDDSREKNGMRLLRCAEYGIYERTLIFSLKYNGKKYIARDIAAMMRDRLELSGIDYDIIVPVPMNRDKELKRGFNQTVLIGRHLARLTGRECQQLLRRTRDTAPMRGLSPTEREMNVKGSFVIDEKLRHVPVEGKKILLLDDFFTTGSTAEECRRVLQTAAPEEIVFLAFAAKY
jgi:competence protein ComFC